MGMLKAWSYSKFSCYKTCPFQFKCRYIDKLKEPPAPPLVRGIAIHQECEDYLNDGGEIPKNLAKLGPEIIGLREKGYVAEEAWALTPKWTEIGFFDKDAWCRMKIDAYGCEGKREMTLVDFKTGKIRGGYLSQLELYAVAAFSLFDDIDTVYAELWYLDHGKIIDVKKDKNSVFHIKDYETLRKRWERRIKPMMADEKFKPTQNQFCNWCSFQKKKGGPCKF